MNALKKYYFVKNTEKCLTFFFFFVTFIKTVYICQKFYIVSQFVQLKTKNYGREKEEKDNQQNPMGCD